MHLDLEKVSAYHAKKAYLGSNAISIVVNGVALVLLIGWEGVVGVGLLLINFLLLGWVVKKGNVFESEIG